MKTWQKLKNIPDLWPRYLLRSQIYSFIREFFTHKGFQEIETPLLAPALPAESYLEIFQTQVLDRNRKAKSGFLTTSPEMWLKKLLVAGVGNCFSITKSFRNTETNSGFHNPEFSILEWYRVNADYREVMGDTEELILFVYDKLIENRVSFPRKRESLRSPIKSGMTKRKTTIIYQNQSIDFSLPWERISMTQAFAKYAKLDLNSNLTLAEIKISAQKKGYQIGEFSTWEEIFNQIYLNEIVPKFNKNKPTIIYDYPVQLAALAKIKSDNPKFCERFEVYIGGIELGDGCSELTNVEEQKKRFSHQLQESQRLGKTQKNYDIEFIKALETGLPKCSGLAMGLDRLLMLFTDSLKIQDVLLFPADQLWENH